MAREPVWVPLILCHFPRTNTRRQSDGPGTMRTPEFTLTLALGETEAVTCLFIRQEPCDQSPESSTGPGICITFTTDAAFGFGQHARLPAMPKAALGPSRAQPPKGSEFEFRAVWWSSTALAEEMLAWVLLPFSDLHNHPRPPGALLLPLEARSRFQVPRHTTPPPRAPAAQRSTRRKTWMSWFLVTRCAFLAVHVAVSSLSPVSIQT